MLSFKCQIIFLLIYLLLKDVLSTNQSKNIRFIDKQKFLRKKRINVQNEVFVFGHQSPDTDTIASALVYASLLRQMQVNAKAYRLGDLNNESKFVLEKASIKEPDMLPSDVAEGSDVALVDHNESKLNQYPI
jgi:nanoRNase/pAp phosphatase (c-di-AMP/oligoRNAs hydrolase)